MIEMTLEDDLPEEFRGGTLRINSENKSADSSKQPNLIQQQSQSQSVDKPGGEVNTNNCHWKNAFIAPLSSIPNKSRQLVFNNGTFFALNWQIKDKAIYQFVPAMSICRCQFILASFSPVFVTQVCFEFFFAQFKNTACTPQQITTIYLDISSLIWYFKDKNTFCIKYAVKFKSK